MLRTPLALVLSLAASGQDPATPAHLRQRLRPFTVEGHGISRLALAEAVAITAEVWAIAGERLELDRRAASKAGFRVALYADRRDYEAAGERTGLGLHEANPAFADSRDDSAYCHVLDASALGGLGPQTRNLVAHEAFHLVVYEFVERGVFLPRWYVEGLSLWVEGEVAQRMGWCAEKAALVGEVDQVRRAQSLLEGGRWPMAQAILLEGREGLAALDTLHAYAVYRMVALWQFERPERFDELWTVARTHGGYPSATRALADDLRFAVGGDARWEDVDRELRAWVAARSVRVERPFVEGPDPRPSSEIPAADRQGSAELDRGGAVQWLGRIAGDRWKLGVACTVPVGPGHRADVVLAARPDGAALRVSLIPGLPGVRVVRRGPAVGRTLAPWELVGEWVDELERTGFDSELELELVARQGRLDVQVDGRRVLRLDAEACGPGFDGAWGLGGLPGGAPVWERIRFP